MAFVLHKISSDFNLPFLKSGPLPIEATQTIVLSKYPKSYLYFLCKCLPHELSFYCFRLPNISYVIRDIHLSRYELLSTRDAKLSTLNDIRSTQVEILLTFSYIRGICDRISSTPSCE